MEGFVGRISLLPHMVERARLIPLGCDSCGDSMPNHQFPNHLLGSAYCDGDFRLRLARRIENANFINHVCGVDFGLSSTWHKNSIPHTANTGE
jgi:hypothetical protein